MHVTADNAARQGQTEDTWLPQSWSFQRAASALSPQYPATLSSARDDKFVVGKAVYTQESLCTHCKTQELDDTRAIDKLCKKAGLLGTPR